MHSKIYINGIHSIAPQPCFDNGFFDNTLDKTPKSFLEVIPPKYTDYIPGKKLRRMTKIIRWGLIGCQKAMEDAHVNQIDSIIIGTGNGNISDTQKFLNAILDNGEKMLVPTSFVQSTNNIVAGNIALMLKNTGYNMTYTHHSTAFEMCLLDALMQFEDKEANSILVGTTEEITKENVQLRNKCALWIKKAINPLDIFKTPTTAAQMGESASFFVLSNKKQQSTYARLIDVELFYQKSSNKVSNRIHRFLQKNDIKENEIDLIIGGFNGVEKYDLPQEALLKKMFPNSPFAAFKQIVGEHPTASAFGLWVASQILSGKNIPKEIYYKHIPKEKKEIKTILIIQKAYLSEEDYGMILMQQA